MIPDNDLTLEQALQRYGSTVEANYHYVKESCDPDAVLTGSEDRVEDSNLAYLAANHKILEHIARLLSEKMTEEDALGPGDDEKDSLYKDPAIEQQVDRVIMACDTVATAYLELARYHLDHIQLFEPQEYNAMTSALMAAEKAKVFYERMQDVLDCIRLYDTHVTDEQVLRNWEGINTVQGLTHQKEHHQQTIRQGTAVADEICRRAGHYQLWMDMKERQEKQEPGADRPPYLSGRQIEDSARALPGPIYNVQKGSQ
ncbi:hypothetical protein GF351_03445 [Candidatus Woesearchaeota archaeon]|nr:hypothetical protein [Candidatus Woesearchaeota archaeon]